MAPEPTHLVVHPFGDVDIYIPKTAWLRRNSANEARRKAARINICMRVRLAMVRKYQDDFYDSRQLIIKWHDLTITSFPKLAVTIPITAPAPECIAQ